MIEISSELKTECMAEWYPGPAKYHNNNKVLAIKILRTATGMGLKECKDIVESGFDTSILKRYNVVLLDTSTPGYHIDRIFALSKELAECYRALEQMGFNFNK